MKKAVFIFVLLFGMCTLAFTQYEAWFSIGYEQGFFLDTYSNQITTIDTNTASEGINISGYRFLKDNIGLFVHGSFLSLKNICYMDNNGLSYIDFTDYGFNMQLGFLIGFAYKIELTNDFKIYFGIGFSYLSSLMGFPGVGNVSYENSTSSYGIGGDIGFKIDLTDRFFLRFGSILGFDFLRYSDLVTYTGAAATSSSSGFDNNFIMFCVRPYLSVGINLNRINDNGRLVLITGKPNQ